MKNNIDSLARGEIDICKKEPIIIPSSIKLEVKYNEQTKVELVIQSPDDKPIKVFTFSDSYHVKVINTKLGNRVNIELLVDTRNYNKDVLIGNITLLSNIGEYKVPYNFKIIKGNIYSILDKLNDKMDFAIIAKEDINAAITIFDYKDFIYAPFMQKDKLVATYKVFKKQNNRELAVEEFLIAIGAKKALSFDIKNEVIKIDDIRNDKYVEIEIKRNFFSYTQISVDNNDEFLELDKNYISNKDFINDICKLKIKIISSKLQNGKNYAHIRLKSNYEEKNICIEINNSLSYDDNEISIEGNKVKNTNIKLEDQKHLLNYFNYRLRYEYNKEEQSILPELMLLELSDVKTCTQSHFILDILRAEAMLLMDNLVEAKKIIENLKLSLRNNDDTYEVENMYVKYLSYLTNKSDMVRIELIHDAQRLSYKYSNDTLFYIALKLKKESGACDAEIYELLYEEYLRGNKSRLLFIKLVEIFNNNIDFLQDLGDMELMAINVGVRLGIVQFPLAKAYSDKSLYVREYKKVMINTLNNLYEKYKDEVFLASICSAIVRFDIRSNKCNAMIYTGIKNNIQIKGMYEHYIKNLDEENTKPLGEKIYRHFINMNIYDIRIKEVLYENILRYVSSDHEIYKAYINEIERFAINQLCNKSVNRHMIYIYRNVIKKHMLDKQVVTILPTILKSYELYCDNDNIDNVVVKYYELDREYIYRLKNNRAYLPIYLDDASIFAQDKYGNRYAGIKLNLIGHKPDEDIIKACYEFIDDNIEIVIQEVRNIINEAILNESMIKTCEQLLEFKEVSEMFKHDVFIKLLQNYRDNYKFLIQDNAWNRSAHDYILSDVTYVRGQADQRLMVEAAISMGCYKEAYNLIKKYTIMDINIDKLYEFCDRIITDTNFSKDPIIDYLAYEVFKNNMASTSIMYYLCKNYNGSDFSMFSILQKSVLEKVDTHDLAKRLMIQLLFTKDHKYMERCFSLCNVDDNEFILIAKAYYTYRCYEYIAHNVDIFKEIIIYIEDIIKNTNDKNVSKLPIIYKLTILKYYAYNKISDENLLYYLKLYINGLINEGILFPFFKNYEKIMDLSNLILDKDILIYIAGKNEEPELFSSVYSISDDINKNKEMEKYKLKKMYLNIYMAENMLFEGDIWKYKIIDKNNKNILKCGNIKHESKENILFSRYNCLNKLISGDDEYKKKYVGQYIVKDILSKDLFDIL